MNFLPKNVYVGSVGGQSINVKEYDNDTYAGLQFAHGFFMLLFFGIVAPFISPLLTIFILLNFNGRFKLGYLLCIIFSGYFLYDAYSGWIVTTLASIALDEYWMNKLVAINASVLGINLFLLIFGRFFKNFNDKSWVLLPIVAVGVISFIYGFNICDKHPDWIDRNLKIGDYKIEQTF